MSIDASSFFNNTPTETHKPAPTRNEDARQNPPDPADQIAAFLYDAPGMSPLSPFIGDEKNRYPWPVPGSTAGEVEFLESLTMACGSPAGPYRVAFVIRCRLERVLRDGAYTVTRVIQRKFAEDGSPIYAGHFISLWKFLQEGHEPDPSWMSKTEWAAIKKAIAPAMTEDERRELAEIEMRNVQAEKRRQAVESAQNPHEALAGGIAAGVAVALEKLGIAAKTQPAK